MDIHTHTHTHSYMYIYIYIYIYTYLKACLHVPKFSLGKLIIQSHSYLTDSSSLLIIDKFQSTLNQSLLLKIHTSI